MLTHLHVKNLALIEEVEVDFEEGLNILTGETGAGKSILIGSINLALGQRVSREMLRCAEKPALVELVFEVGDLCCKKLQALDIPMEDNQVILSRKITGTRSVNKINGETVPVLLLKQAAELLIDIHGQHEHQSLLKKEKHLEILDEFAKDEIKEPMKLVQDWYEQYKKLTKKLEQFEMDTSEREREIAFLKYEIDEIDNANLNIGEDDALEMQFRKMQHGKKIIEGLNTAYHLTGMGEQSAADCISVASGELSSIVSYDEDLDSLYGQIQDIESLITDFNRDVEQYIRNYEFGEEEYYRTEERLNVLNHLKSKYGNTIEEILNYRNLQEEKQKELEDYEQTFLNLKEEQKNAQKELEAACKKITAIRKKYAKGLIGQIKAALVDLNFIDVQFEAEFTKTPNYQKNGLDEVEFLISTNPGEKPRPLGKVASGGELSRIMLAIKTILADKDEIDTLIFDEIDVGISGRTAQKVSEKMSLIGKSRQVISITHLAQIAAMADAHYLIEKKSDNQETLTTINRLSKQESVEELARILSGAKVTKAVLENAGEMKELAEKAKAGK